MKGAAFGEPEGLPAAAELRGAGRPQTMTLALYGSTHLRLTTLPVIHITDQSQTAEFAGNGLHGGIGSNP